MPTPIGTRACLQCSGAGTTRERMSNDRQTSREVVRGLNTPTRKRRIYVAGPYSNPDRATEWVNVARAAQVGAVLMKAGHLVHVPHAATQYWHKDEAIGYEQFMELDLSIIRLWATDLLYLAPSPGADRERDLAGKLGLPIWLRPEDVPAPEQEGGA